MFKHSQTRTCFISCAEFSYAADMDMQEAPQEEESDSSGDKGDQEEEKEIARTIDSLASHFRELGFSTKSQFRMDCEFSRLGITDLAGAAIVKCVKAMPSEEIKSLVGPRAGRRRRRRHMSNEAVFHTSQPTPTMSTRLSKLDQWGMHQIQYETRLLRPALQMMLSLIGLECLHLKPVSIMGEMECDGGEYKQVELLSNFSTSGEMKNFSAAAASGELRKK
jgi:hypothetical protein